jgi:Family of unknown function (DUF5724)/Domain of unknown function (DUF4132)
MSEKETPAILAPYRQNNIIETFKTDLSQFYGNGLPRAIFSKIKQVFQKSGSTNLSSNAAELGLLLVNGHPGLPDNNDYYSLPSELTYLSERYKRIVALLGDDGWLNPELYALLVFFFGEEKAAYALRAWTNIPRQMYQKGYTRRSFRAPNTPEIYLLNQINFLIRLIPQSYTVKYLSSEGYKPTFYNLSIIEQVQLGHYAGDSNAALFHLWSAAIDQGNAALLKTMEDIIFNRDEKGKVTRSLIKGLLNSNSEPAWVLVEKLLLAAQRQEGLRQTILEALDETSIGALKYMIRVILNQQLTRFSSVVRAVDVWAGLDWESERETTVKKFLEKASLYLEDPALIPDAVRSDNNADVYMALWAQGVYDVEKTKPYLEQLMSLPQPQKRSLALLFCNQTQHFKLTMPFYYLALDEKDLEPLAYAVIFIYNAVITGKNNELYNELYPLLFDKLVALYNRIETKEKIFDGHIFSWSKVHFEKKTILRTLLHLVLDQHDRLELVFSYFDEMDAATKHELSRRVLPDQSAYNYTIPAKPTAALTVFQRQYALAILKDRSEYAIGYNALYFTKLTANDLVGFPELFKRKAAGFRSNLISLLLKQDDAVKLPVIKTILLEGDPEQRVAGLDMLLQLNKTNKLPGKCRDWITEFRNRKSISPKEEILLTQLEGKKENKVVSEENGYGLYDPKNLSRVIAPTIDPDCLYENLTKKIPYGFTMKPEAIKATLATLDALYQQHKDYEYEVQTWNNATEKVLLGNGIRTIAYNLQSASPQENFMNYPLHEVWDSWFRQSGLQAQDLFAISLYGQYDWGRKSDAFTGLVPKQEDYMPPVKDPNTWYGKYLYTICRALLFVHPYAEANAFSLGACNRLFASLGKDVLQSKDESYYYSRHRGWQEVDAYMLFLKTIDWETLTPEQVKQYWDLYHWRQYAGLEEYQQESIPPLWVFCLAYQHKNISKDDLVRGMLTADNIRQLTGKNNLRREADYHKRFPFLEPLLQPVTEQILDVELKRGDSPTALTHLAGSLQSVLGIKRLAELLAGLGRTTLNKGYVYYMNGDNSKQEVFSALIKRCQPLPTDDQASFDATIRAIKVSEKRLIEIAIYAPQWQPFISEHLNWKGMDSAIWWMHAHTKTESYQAQSAEAESEIAKYSTLDVEEFKDGAVDKDWFHMAYAAIGKNRWPILYDAAKYISDGNGHRRARIYADVLLGILPVPEVLDKLTTKRDQDYLRVYGLAPLHKKDPAKDILERYAYIQAFKKESRQFGAQKQTSEAAAIRVALENLARNAGYPDPIRFTWAMETKQVQSIFTKETQVLYDDILIGLVIDEDGQADVVAFKDQKALKAIPAKYKKDSKVEELQQFKKTLREQYRRSSKGLEDAMVRGDVFQVSEISDLNTHPVIAKHLEKLVFVTDGENGALRHGFFADGSLVTPDGEVLPLSANDGLRIAHCTDLFTTGAWAAYQAYAFDRKLQQPFKQVFRELYLPTADELAEKSVSRRYAGHQVQPKQTVALLKTRGWKVNYEEGLQKVYHKEGFAVRLYALADWFSPAEVENPTLETIQFENLKDGKLVAFESIHPRIFSEVMRDIDLVVSVAHAGAVDAEASHSSIEMRSVLLRETLRLFKIANVTIGGSHAHIKGTLGEYNIHLGSAVVHKQASGYLSIIPVHAQQRGRLFLPFADDDPKSAELISKVLLLAKDGEIQDPSILRQLG